MQAGSDAAVNATISGEISDQAVTVVVTVFRTSCKRKWREAGPSSRKQRTDRSDVAATTVLADQDLGKKKPNGVGLTTKAGETLSSLHKGDHCAGCVIKYYKVKPAICSINELKPYCQQEMIWLAPNETLLRYVGRAYCQPCVLQTTVEVTARFCGAAVAHLCVDRRQRRMLSRSGTNRTTRHWTHCSHRNRQRKRKRHHILPSIPAAMLEVS